LEEEEEEEACGRELLRSASLVVIDAPLSCRGSAAVHLASSHEKT